VAERKRQVICESLQTRMPVIAFRRRRVWNYLCTLIQTWFHQ
jgi:hypothetical protein